MLIICIKTTINCESEETAFSKLSKTFRSLFTLCTRSVTNVHVNVYVGVKQESRNDDYLFCSK